MKSLLTILLSISILPGCAQQEKPNSADINVGGSCEGCEAIFETRIPFQQLNAVDTLPDFPGAGPKIHIYGTIYQSDGRTPADNVVLYVYHTDQNGIYPKNANEKGWAQRHGYIRGWIRTGKDGRYDFYTLVPASYPNSTNPKHIHPVVKEQGKTAYWIDEFVFDDDPLLPAAERQRAEPVGGNGVLKTVSKAGMLEAKRDIILGLNVRNYPKQKGN